MKKINKLIITLMIITLGLTGAQNLKASGAEGAELKFFAINAGYTDEEKIPQNYDFIELVRVDGAEIELKDYTIIYTNSAGKVAGEIIFASDLKLVSERLVLGSKYSAQYKNFDERYLYNFGSTGLASTAGKLTLMKGDRLVDERCWGSLSCSNGSWVKFASSQADNFSMKLINGVGFEATKYYPEINALALSQKILLGNTDEKGDGTGMALQESSCKGVIFSEVYSYFENSYDEQFVELYNPGWAKLNLDGCSIVYKNKSFALNGDLGPDEYLAYRDENLRLTKNPSSNNEILLVDAAGDTVDILIYTKGQKKGKSWSLMDFDDSGAGVWMQTYRMTPGSSNVFQEFRTCPSGKIINPSTGNCINASEEDEPAPCPEGKFRNPETGRCKSYATLEKILAPCEEGYYRNPETNRCKKIASLAEEKASCQEGYERNPETGRCRKIRVNNGADYPIEAGEYDGKMVFTAYGILVILLFGGIVYVIFQFRKELNKRVRRYFGNWRIWRILSILVSRVGNSVNRKKQLTIEFGKKVYDKIKAHSWN